MFVKLHSFIHILKQFPLHNIPDHVELTFDITGFSLKGKDLEETKELNEKWNNYIIILNKLAGTEEYLTIAEIATHLQVSQASVHKIIKGQDKNNPILPYIETSVGKRIKSSDYIHFLESCYEPSSSSFVQSIENPLS